MLFVEATDFPGKGNLTITGQLGDVMKESAQAALSFVRAHANEFNPDLPADYFQNHDIHVHVPAGAIPKDGPSAGVTMATAIASLISGRPVRDDTAMTGELTLTGQVLPIGGLKEKALAAQDAGIERVIAPKLNEQDVEDIPEHLRKDIEFVFVERIEQVLEQALETKSGPRTAPAQAGARARKAAAERSTACVRSRSPSLRARQGRGSATSSPKRAPLEVNRLELGPVRAGAWRTRPRAAGADGRSSRPPRCRA